jgi:hypothetical protein
MDLNGEKIRIAVAEVKAKIADRGTQFPDEELLWSLKSRGLGKVETLKVLIESFDIPFPALKDFVHGSQAWAEQKVSDDALHDSIERDPKV